MQTYCGRNFCARTWQQIIRQWHIFKFRWQCRRFHFNDIRIVRWHRFFIRRRVIVGASNRWIRCYIHNWIRIVCVTYNLRFYMTLKIRRATALSWTRFMHHRWYQRRWIKIQFTIYRRFRTSTTGRCGACTSCFGNTRIWFTANRNKQNVFSL